MERETQERREPAIKEREYLQWFSKNIYQLWGSGDALRKKLVKMYGLDSDYQGPLEFRFKQKGKLYEASFTSDSTIYLFEWHEGQPKKNAERNGTALTLGTQQMWIDGPRQPNSFHYSPESGNPISLALDDIYRYGYDSFPGIHGLLTTDPQELNQAFEETRVLISRVDQMATIYSQQGSL